MANVVSLETRPAKINAETIRILKDFLAQAERGEIYAVAIAAAHPDGSISHENSESDHFHHLIGAIAMMQHKMLAGKCD